MSNPNPKTLEPEWLLHDRRTTRVVAQQYPSVNIFPMRLILEMKISVPT